MKKQERSSSSQFAALALYPSRVFVIQSCCEGLYRPSLPTHSSRLLLHHRTVTLPTSIPILRNHPPLLPGTNTHAACNREGADGWRSRIWHSDTTWEIVHMYQRRWTWHRADCLITPLQSYTTQRGIHLYQGSKITILAAFECKGHGHVLDTDGSCLQGRNTQRRERARGKLCVRTGLRSAILTDWN